MATKNNPGAYDCHASAKPDEPLFTLIARDPTFAAVIQLWSVLRARVTDQGADSAQTGEAQQCALAAIQYAGRLGKVAQCQQAIKLAGMMIDSLHVQEAVALAVLESQKAAVRGG